MKMCSQCRGTYPAQFTVCPQDGTPLRAVTELPEGAAIRGKYRILSKLGEGGMGVVYKARHVHFDEVCALKLVSASLVEDPTFLQRFNTEALLMRRLNHPHALRVHDIDETEDGNPFIVMEYVEGESLADLLHGGQPLPPERAMRIAMQVCEALGAAHHMGIIHRDIKPSNIMLARAADRSDHVKVFDFGIAKVKEGSALRSGASLTQTGMIVGTPAYMSPEQCKGLRGEKLDGRSDLYSLGIVLYQMLTGRLPFEAETPTELLLAHLQQAPPDPRWLNAALPQQLADIVLRAVEKDPGKRFPGANEMRDALHAVLESPTFATGKTTVGVFPRRAPPGQLSAPPVDSETETWPRTPVPELTATPTGRVVTPQSAARATPRSPSLADASPAPVPSLPLSRGGEAARTAPRTFLPRWVYAAAGSLAVIAILAVIFGRWEMSPPTTSAPTETTRTKSAGPPPPAQTVPTKGESSQTKNAARPLGGTSGEPPVDACGGTPRCYSAGPFMAEVIGMTPSQMPSGYHVLQVNVRFRNLTNQPLILAYVAGSGVITDNNGKRYEQQGSITPGARGIGTVDKNKADPQFVLSSGASSNASFVLSRSHGANDSRDPIGTTFNFDLSIAQLEVLPSRQVRTHREYSVGFTDLGNSAAPAGSSSRTAATSQPPVSGDAPVSPVAASSQVDACGGTPRCYSAGPFMAEVIGMTPSQMPSGYHVLQVNVRFRNLTNQPLILAYVAGSGVITDDNGKRYEQQGSITPGARGIGTVDKNKADPQFVLSSGASSNASFVLSRSHGANDSRDPIGTTFNFDLSIAQLEVLPGQPIRTVREYAVTFSNLTATGGGAGNVEEWVNDWYGPYSSAAATGPTLPALPCPTWIPEFLGVHQHASLPFRPFIAALELPLQQHCIGPTKTNETGGV